MTYGTPVRSRSVATETATSIGSGKRSGVIRPIAVHAAHDLFAEPKPSESEQQRGLGIAWVSRLEPRERKPIDSEGQIANATKLLFRRYFRIQSRQDRSRSGAGIIDRRAVCHPAIYRRSATLAPWPVVSENGSLITRSPCSF